MVLNNLEYLLNSFCQLCFSRGIRTYNYIRILTILVQLLFWHFWPCQGLLNRVPDVYRYRRLRRLKIINDFIY